MLIETMYTPWRLARAVNQTSGTAVAHNVTLTEPTGDAGTATGASILTIGSPASFTQNALVIMPFGVGSDDTTFSFDIWAWAPGVLPNSVNQFTWFPILLAEIACTLDSGCPGVANGFTPTGASDYFCDTLALTYGNANVSIEVFSPAATGYPGHVLVSSKGFQRFELSFFTGSSATSGNALVRFL